MWNPFRRRGKEEAPAAPAGPTPAAPTPAPAAPEAPKRSRLGRLFGRKPKPAPAPAEAPAAPAGPPPAPEQPPRVYPGGLDVSASGTWKISSSIWHGTASGTLTGAAVKVFLDAIESGDNETPTFLIAQAYDNGSGFAQNLDLAGTSVDITYG